MTLQVNPTLRVSSSGPAEDGWCCVRSQVRCHPLLRQEADRATQQWRQKTPRIQCQIRCSCRWRGPWRLDCRVWTLSISSMCLKLRPWSMRSIPKFMRGVFRGAMKVGLHEITKGSATNNVQVESRGWKLFMLLPRLLLSKPSRAV